MRSTPEHTWPQFMNDAPQCTVDGACEVGVVEHDHRILAAELERHRHQALGRRRRDEAANLGRAGEHTLSSPRALTSAAPTAPSPCASRTGGAPAVANSSRDERARERRQLGRLEHHGVPRGERICDLGERDREREVPR